MSWQIFIYLFILLVLIYIYKRKLINYRKLVPAQAEIDKIKVGYISTSQPGAGNPRSGGILPRSGQSQDSWSAGSMGMSLSGNSGTEISEENVPFRDVTMKRRESAIPIPEVLVQYSYQYKGKNYKGEQYILIRYFLRDTPYQLDFNRLGPDFPVLIVPGKTIVGEENIENYLLSYRNEMEIHIDIVNPHLSILEFPDSE